MVADVTRGRGKLLDAIIETTNPATAPFAPLIADAVIRISEPIDNAGAIPYSNKKNASPKSQVEQRTMPMIIKPSNMTKKYTGGPTNPKRLPNRPPVNVARATLLNFIITHKFLLAYPTLDFWNQA